MCFLKQKKDSSNRIDFYITAENHVKLHSIAETPLFFCGRQGIAFHGHHDDRPSVEEHPVSNHRNFLTLLQFCIQAGDKVFYSHLASAAGNTNYTSKSKQIKLICICGDVVHSETSEKILKSGYFSVILDKATNVLNDNNYLLAGA